MSDSPAANGPDDFAANFQQDLIDYFDDLLTYRMPFGKYKDRHLDHLPYEYLHWFPERCGGFPSGRLGELMAFVYHTKSVGAEIVFKELDVQRKKGGVKRG